MADKELEKKAVGVVFSKMKYLQGYVDVSDEKQERPDFVYRKQNQIIGVEHIELPLLPMKRGQNTEHFFHGQCLKTYNSWKDNYQDDYEGVVQDIQNLVNDKLKAYADFTYDHFFINAAKLLGIISDKGQHRKHNATEYLAEIKEKYPECECKIVFILDVGYTKSDLSHFQYRDHPGDAFVTQRRTEFPFTITFLVLLGFIKDVKDVFLVWHPHNEYEGKHVKCYGLHYDSNHYMQSADNVRYYCWEFDMPEKMKRKTVKIDFKQDDNV